MPFFAKHSRSAVKRFAPAPPGPPAAAFAEELVLVVVEEEPFDELPHAASTKLASTSTTAVAVADLSLLLLM
jgi:hypothetical protein